MYTLLKRFSQTFYLTPKQVHKQFFFFIQKLTHFLANHLKLLIAEFNEFFLWRPNNKIGCLEHTNTLQYIPWYFTYTVNDGMSEVKAWQRSNGRGCFIPHFFRTFHSFNCLVKLNKRCTKSLRHNILIFLFTYCSTLLCTLKGTF